LNVRCFLIRHGVVNNMNFDTLSLALSGLEQETMTGVKSIEGTTDQTPLERSVAHAPRTEQRPFIPSPRRSLGTQVCAPAPNGLSHR